ncbi:Succinate dehydrogenase assembly factor 2 [Raphanus sativus]|nr:Succinate dehydrogenase assembly factor 2 [Raphanus sativus]
MANRKALINIHRIIRSAAVVNRRSVIPAAATQSHPIFRNGVGLGARFLCGNTSSPQNFDIDLSTEEKKRITINRLLYRSKQRGFLELDLVLGNWVEENVNSMDENTVKSLIHVLDLENPDLWKWLTGSGTTSGDSELKPGILGVAQESHDESEQACSTGDTCRSWTTLGQRLG